MTERNKDERKNNDLNYENIKNNNEKQTGHKLNIMYTNIDSLHNKIDELSLYMKLHNIDISLICETLPKNPTYNENFFLIDGYKCLENNSGRGVCIFYRETLIIEEHKYINDMFSPSIYINVLTSHKPLNLGLVYRSPNSDDAANNNLKNQLNFVNKKLNNLIIMGDFNYPSIDWENMYCKKNEEHCDSKFLFEISNMKLQQLIESPTHYKPNCKPSLIDLVITKRPDLIYEIKQNPPIAKSHHTVITAKINAHDVMPDQKQDQEITTKYNIKKADFEAIKTYLDTVNWDIVLKDTEDIDKCWNGFSNEINIIKEKFLPKIKIHDNKIKRSIPFDITLHQLKKKRNMFKVFKKYKTVTNENLYCKARNEVSKKVKQLKREKENKIAKNIKSNPKAFYDYISAKTTKKEGITILKDEKGNTVKSNLEKCNVMNDYFSSVFTREDSNEAPSLTNTYMNNTLTSCHITEMQMSEALKNLNPNKSPGPDNIHPRLLKEIHKQIAKPLKTIFDLLI